MPKLSDTQAVLLAAAAARPDLSVLPPPDTIRLKGAALDRTLRALVTRGLIAEARRGGETLEVGQQPPGRHAIRPRRDRGRDGGTCAGRLRDRVRPGAADASRAPPQRPGGKLGVLLAAVARPEGATLDDLTAASGWLPHTTRAALTRLRQRGYDVRLADTGTRKAYHLVPAD